MRRISEILQDERMNKEFKLVDVVRATKIKKEFLIAIENGDFHSLPSETYALGFVKNYAQFLGIDVSKAAALFRREYESGITKALPTFKSRDSSLRRKVIFTPKSFLIVSVLVIILGFIAFQFSSFFIGPALAVVYPGEGQVIEQNIVDVRGKTDPYASVLVNGEEVYVKLDGSFKKTLYLYEGKKEITIVSRNRNGKETKKAINVMVK